MAPIHPLMCVTIHGKKIIGHRQQFFHKLIDNPNRECLQGSWIFYFLFYEISQSDSEIAMLQ